MKKQSNWLIAVVAVFCLLAIVTGCVEKKGPLEKAGEKVDDAIDDAGDAIEDAGDEIEDAVEGGTTNP